MHFFIREELLISSSFLSKDTVCYSSLEKYFKKKKNENLFHTPFIFKFSCKYDKNNCYEYFRRGRILITWSRISTTSRLLLKNTISHPRAVGYLCSFFGHHPHFSSSRSGINGKKERSPLEEARPRYKSSQRGFEDSGINSGYNVNIFSVVEWV